jgi:hypothetical protein
VLGKTPADEKAQCATHLAGGHFEEAGNLLAFKICANRLISQQKEYFLYFGVNR